MTSFWVKLSLPIFRILLILKLQTFYDITVCFYRAGMLHAPALRYALFAQSSLSKVNKILVNAFIMNASNAIVQLHKWAIC